MEPLVQPVSPEEVFLCVLAELIVNPPAEDEETGSSLNQGRVARQLSVLILKQIKTRSSACYPTLTQLIDTIREQLPDAGAEIVRGLALRLSQLESPDDVQSLFLHISSMLLDPSKPPPPVAREDAIAGIEPGSPIGLFIRRCRASLAHMPFEALAALYSAIQQQLVDTMGGEGGSSGSLRPATAVNNFLGAQLQRIEKQGPASSAAAIEAHLAPLGLLQEELPQAQFVRLAGALAGGDYSASLDLLHRYYDYVQGGGQGLAGQGVGGGEARHQTALLSLTSAQVAFGHVDSALQALNETLQVAQQNRDPWCLVHALAALCRTMAASALSTTSDAGPGSSSHAKMVELARLLRRCQASGADMGCPHLVAYARVALARFSLLHSLQPADSQPAPELEGPDGGSQGGSQGGSISSAVELQRALRQACNLAHASQLAAALPFEPPPAAPYNPDGMTIQNTRSDNLYDQPAVFGRCARATQLASALAARQLSGSAHALVAASWAMHGAAALAHTHALVQVMGQQVSGRDEDLALAWAQLAEVTAARRGVEAGQQVLQLAAPQLPPDAHKPLAAARQLLAHQQALNQGALHRAQREARELLALCSKAGAGSSACAATDATSTQQADSSGSYSQLQMRLEARRRVLQNLLAAQDYEAALKEAGGLWADAAAARLHMEAVQGLLGLAQVHQAAGHPVGSFPYVLSALLQAQTSGLDLLAAQATVLLAQLWPLLVPSPSTAAHAAALVQEVLPVLYAHGSVEQVSDACAVLADLLLAHRSKEGLAGLDAGWCRELLGTAAEGYGQVCAWRKAAQSYYLLAQLCEAGGCEGERDAAAERYHEALVRCQG